MWKWVQVFSLLKSLLHWKMCVTMDPVPQNDQLGKGLSKKHLWTQSPVFPCTELCSVNPSELTLQEKKETQQDLVKTLDKEDIVSLTAFLPFSAFVPQAYLAFNSGHHISHRPNRAHFDHTSHLVVVHKTPLKSHPNVHDLDCSSLDHDCGGAHCPAFLLSLAHCQVLPCCWCKPGQLKVSLLWPNKWTPRGL